MYLPYRRNKPDYSGFREKMPENDTSAVPEFQFFESQ